MPRPRRPFSGQEIIVDRRAGWWEDTFDIEVGVREAERLRSSRHWKYVVPNGYQDPLTFMFVVDGLLRIDPQIELRASNLADWLGLRFPQMVFDAPTVGRVLAEIADSQNELLGEKKGFLQPSRDRDGAFYSFWVDEESVKALFALRRDLYKLAENSVIDYRRGNREKSLGSPLLECPSLRGEWKGV